MKSYRLADHATPVEYSSYCDWAPPNSPNYEPTHTRYLVRTCSKVPKKEACYTQIRCEIENLCHILIVDVIAFPNSVKVINQHFKLKWILLLLIPIRRLYPKIPVGQGLISLIRNHRPQPFLLQGSCS